jgi:hypothetical protein
VSSRNPLTTRLAVDTLLASQFFNSEPANGGDMRMSMRRFGGFGESGFSVLRQRLQSFCQHFIDIIERAVFKPLLN